MTIAQGAVFPGGGSKFVGKLSPCLKQKTALKEVRIVDRKVHRPDLAFQTSKSCRTNQALRNAIEEMG